MANYPSLPQWQGTKLVPRAGVLERMATNGTLRQRALYSNVKYDITVVHSMMSAANRTALLDFYTANRTLTFTFTATEDGVARTCMFASMPFQIEPVAGLVDTYSAQVFMREA